MIDRFDHSECIGGKHDNCALGIASRITGMKAKEESEKMIFAYEWTREAKNRMKKKVFLDYKLLHISCPFSDYLSQRIRTAKLFESWLYLKNKHDDFLRTDSLWSVR